MIKDFVKAVESNQWDDLIDFFVDRNYGFKLAQNLKNVADSNTGIRKVHYADEKGFNECLFYITFNNNKSMHYLFGQLDGKLVEHKMSAEDKVVPFNLEELLGKKLNSVNDLTEEDKKKLTDHIFKTNKGC